MRTNIVLTLTGADRVGLVEEITELLLSFGGNVETSRMARLGGEFAVLMLVSMPSLQLANLENAIPQLASRGYKVTTTLTEQTYAQAHAGWLPYRLEVQGADHEGIIHEIAHALSQRGISIESMDTSSTPAPISGTPVFAMTALVIVPPSLPGQDWKADLEAVGHHLHMDIEVSSVAK